MTDTQIPGGLPIAITLTVAQWRTVLQLLYEGPFSLRVAGPIYGDIDRQAAQAIAAQMRANGGTATTEAETREERRLDG